MAPLLKERDPPSLPTLSATPLGAPGGAQLWGTPPRRAICCTRPSQAEWGEGARPLPTPRPGCGPPAQHRGRGRLLGLVPFGGFYFIFFVVLCILFTFFSVFRLSPGATPPAADPRPNLSGPDLQPSLISDYLKITVASGRVLPGPGWRVHGHPRRVTPSPFYLFIFLHESLGRHCSAHAREVKGERSGCG